MSICTYCGAEIPDGAKFCGVCGRVPSNDQSTVRSSSPNNPARQSNISSNAPYPIKNSTRRPYQYPPVTPDPQPQPGYQSQPRWSDAEPSNAYNSQQNARLASWQQGSSYPPQPPNAPSYPAQ